MALACLLALAGCHDDRHADSGDDHADHAGHVIPAHKPKSFPEAVRRLRSLNEAIALAVQGGRARSLADDGTLSIALDIAAWLPEIAADSDMPEGPWDEVNAQSEALVADYRALRAVDGDMAAQARDAARHVAALDVVLARADPGWFGKAVGEGDPREIPKEDTPKTDDDAGIPAPREESQR
jgi:hypothetical protein